MYLSGTFTPKDFMVPKEVLHCLDAFQQSITSIFKKKQGHNNLFSDKNEPFLTFKRILTLSDTNVKENLGPAILKNSIYIKKAMKDHPSDIKLTNT
eukprot:13906447-Ditylum_brightwellii.AAC.1